MSRLKKDPIEGPVEFASTVDVCMIPPSVINFQCKRLLDNLGCLAAGYQQSGIDTALKMARRWSGCAEAHVLGSHERLAAPQAAFVNAVRARSLDYCDVLSPGWHPSSSDIPVAIAAAELNAASGLDMLAALAVAQDFGQRINLAAQANGFLYRGFDSNILGLFSGVVIGARLLNLNPQQFRNAVGLAFDFGIGTFQHYQDKTLAVRFSQGFVARHALEAALLAREGISGPYNVLCGENGFFNLYAPDKPDLNLLFHRLGNDFLGEEATCFKLYPHCSILLALTDTLLNTKLPPELISDPRTRILLKASPTMHMVCGTEYTPNLTPEIDAQFSAQYIIANALLRGSATPAEFCADAAKNAQILAFTQRIEINKEPEFERFDRFELIFTTVSGNTHTIGSSYGRGWPENAASMQNIRDKFISCCTFSPCTGFSQHSQELIAKIEQLTEASSITDLIDTLSNDSVRTQSTQTLTKL
jgi:2-methylcitrate dehydratase PrpD